MPAYCQLCATTRQHCSRCPCCWQHQHKSFYRRYSATLLAIVEQVRRALPQPTAITRLHPGQVALLYRARADMQAVPAGWASEEGSLLGLRVLIVLLFYSHYAVRDRRDKALFQDMLGFVWRFSDAMCVTMQDHFGQRHYERWLTDVRRLEEQAGWVVSDRERLSAIIQARTMPPRAIADPHGLWGERTGNGPLVGCDCGTCAYQREEYRRSMRRQLGDALPSDRARLASL